MPVSQVGIFSKNTAFLANSAKNWILTLAIVET